MNINKQQKNNQFVVITEKELFVRLEYLKKNDQKKFEELRKVIEDLFSGDIDDRNKQNEVQIELGMYYKYFIGNKKSASLILKKKEKFNRILVSAKNLIHQNRVETLIIPFSKGKEITIIKRGMTNELVFNILKKGYNNDENNFR